MMMRCGFLHFDSRSWLIGGFTEMITTFNTLNTDPESPKKKPPVKRIIAGSIFIVLAVASFFVYNNFNRLLSEALITNFNSNIVSDVYELKFEKLRVNFLEGSVRVVNVVLQPREKPLRDYPYINSSFRLSAERITLMNVQLFAFLKTKKFNLDRIAITKPDIGITIGGKNPVFFPFRDSTTNSEATEESGKKAIDAFILNEFQLIEASFNIVNTNKQREFSLGGFNISLYDLRVSQQPGKDVVSLKRADLSVGEFSAGLRKGGMKSAGFNNFKLGIDSLDIQKSVDTVTFHFHDFTAGLDALDIQTADSLYHITMRSFEFSYKDKAAKLGHLSYKPNVTDAELQNKFKHQRTLVSGVVGSMNFKGVNFDSLIYHRTLLIDELLIDQPDLSIFRDNTKPIDSTRFPLYLGQQIRAIPIPLRVKEAKFTRVHLVNVERKPDSTYAKVNIHRGKISAKNITNRSVDAPLVIVADAFIENKVHFNLRLDFNYRQPQFGMSGKLERFSLPDLNPVMMAYTPGTATSGIADEITFSAIVDWTQSSGTMKFLYHDLKVDLDIKDKAKWKSTAIAFAANSLVRSSNPSSEELPPRIVQLQAKRNMNKGFINLIMKSVLNGVKETMIMSKENRKAYHEAKKKSKEAR